MIMILLRGNLLLAIYKDRTMTKPSVSWKTRLPLGIIKRIHVNQHVIKRNQKTGEKKPVLTVKTSKSNDYGHEVKINGDSKVIYSPDKPLSCGARVWIETYAEVEIYEDNID